MCRLSKLAAKPRATAHGIRSARSVAVDGHRSLLFLLDQLAAKNPNVTNFPKRARLAKQMRAMVSPGPGRLLVEVMPARPEANALLALMLLHDARRDARAAPNGDAILLEAQDRARWDKTQIAEGLEWIEAALHALLRPNTYAVQAAIAALHMRAARYEDTDWPQIAALYEVLIRIHPSPVVELNHAVAVSMVDGPERALRLVDSIAKRGELNAYHMLPAVRADLLRRLGRRAEAIEAYQQALKGVELERDQTLVVIHAEHRIEFTFDRAMKNCVRGMRTGKNCGLRIADCGL